MLVKILNTLNNAAYAAGYASFWMRCQIRETRQAGQTHLLIVASVGFLLQGGAIGYAATHPNAVAQLFFPSAHAAESRAPALPGYVMQGELAHIKAALRKLNPKLLNRKKAPIYDEAPGDLLDVVTPTLREASTK